MHSDSDIPRWNGQPLGGDLIGLAWPELAGPDNVFAAAGEPGVVLVPGAQLSDFLSAHPRARFVADVAQRHNLDVTLPPVHTAVCQGRLYDIGLLSTLVGLAMKTVRRALPGRVVSDTWPNYAVALREEATALLRHAEAARASVEPTPFGAQERFGPLGIGLDVRGALAAARGGRGLRLRESERLRVLAALGARQNITRAALRESPAARALNNTPGGANFLEWGALGAEPNAIRVFAGAALAGVRMRGRLPVPVPADLTDPAPWELLAPHSEAVAASAELRTLREIRDALEKGERLVPDAAEFPELRLVRPDVAFVRRVAGKGIFVPAESGNQFLIVSLPDLELRALALCLERRYGDGTLARELREHGGAGVRLRAAQAASGLEADEFLRLLQSGRHEVCALTGVADAVLQYLPRGVTTENLEFWLARYVAGGDPTTRQVNSARRAFERLAPALERYCQRDIAQLVAANLGSSQGDLEEALAAFARDLNLGREGELSRVIERMLRPPDENPLSDGNRLAAFFRSGGAFPNNPLSDRPFGSPAALAGALLAADYRTPTGRIYGEATPLEAVGRDHLELADAVRKAVFFALTAANFQVAAFDREEFAVVVPRDCDRGSLAGAAVDLVRGALAGWADGLAAQIQVPVSETW